MESQNHPVHPESEEELERIEGGEPVEKTAEPDVPPAEESLPAEEPKE